MDKNRLPVIIGAGQDSRPVPEDLNSAFGPSDLAGAALKRAFDDAGLKPSDLDAIYGVRLFGDSGPVFPNPFGRPQNFPESVAKRVGVKAARYIYDHVGGQSPQTLVAEAAQSLMAGEIKTAAIVGGEAIANIKAGMRAGAKPDWNEASDSPLEDRGLEPKGIQMVHAQAVNHGLLTPMHYYALIETANRHRRGESVATYSGRMSRLLERFAAVAADNPYASIRDGWSGEEIVSASESNPPLLSPYQKRMVARDRVNLGATILMTTYGYAKSLGVSDEAMTFLHAHDDATEPPLITRAEIDRSEAQQAVLSSVAGAADVYDLYSCFPIVPFEAMRLLGLNEDEAITLTGGLPFFGGPGNNYSLHAIAEAHTIVRGLGKTALIYANGGLASKHAAGLYSGVAPDEMDIRKSGIIKPAKEVVSSDNPIGRLISYTIEHRKSVPIRVYAMGETEAGDRFYARGDEHVARLFQAKDPLGDIITTETENGINGITTA